MILYQYCIFFVKKLQYWNNFLYQYCQQYWYTSIVITKYRRSERVSKERNDTYYKWCLCMIRFPTTASQVALAIQMGGGGLLFSVVYSAFESILGFNLCLRIDLTVCFISRFVNKLPSMLPRTRF